VDDRVGLEMLLLGSSDEMKQDGGWGYYQRDADHEKMG
jgi:hypothetical protein